MNYRHLFFFATAYHFHLYSANHLFYLVEQKNPEPVKKNTITDGLTQY